MSLKTPIQLKNDAGQDQTTTTSSIAIPDNASGFPAEYVVVGTNIACGFMPIQSGETPALSTMARLQDAQSMVLNVAGYTHIRFETLAGGTTDPQVVPLENQ